MLEITRNISRWIFKYFLSFLMVVAVLVFGNIVREELRKYETVTDDLSILLSGKNGIEKAIDLLQKEAESRVSSLNAATDATLKARVVTIEGDIASLRSRQKGHGVALSLLSGDSLRDIFVDHVKLDVEIEILGQELDYLRQSIRILNAASNRTEAQKVLNARRQAHALAYNALLQLETELASARKEMTWADHVNFFSAQARLVKARQAAYEAQRIVNDDAYRGYLQQLDILKAITVPPVTVFKVQRDRVDSLLEPLLKQISDLEERDRSNWIKRAFSPFLQVIPTALYVIVAAIFLPIAIKLFLYFLVAPWATGRRAVCLLPLANGEVSSTDRENSRLEDAGSISAVSRNVLLGENDELLIRPEYLQSTSVDSNKRTKWLLSWKFPYASLLSGMFMLTRVTAKGKAPVVISANNDPFSEVGVVCLSEGAALVCQPRSLVGVIQDKGSPIRITRHWRLGSLQAWLTLQLRFLAFHGPGQLVLQGCRGIRMEKAGQGRIINQAATLGFSANTEYANSRCETFVSYWTGKEELFNDLFLGNTGVYVYEEMPGLKRKAGMTGRGLEGFIDSILKVFGI